MVNRLMIVKLIYLTILLTGCHGSVADDEQQTSEKPVAVDYALIDVENLDGDPQAMKFFRYRDGVELEQKHFELVDGKGVPVCEAYIAYLSRQLYAERNTGPRCYRWFMKEYGGISRPAVEILSEEEERRVLPAMKFKNKKQREAALSTGVYFYSSITWKLIQPLDIDNDGATEFIYFEAENRCNEDNYDASRKSFHIHPFPWDESEQQPDYELMKIMAGYYEYPKLAEASWFRHLDQVLSIFNFEGKTYFDGATSMTTAQVLVDDFNESTRNRIENIFIHKIIQGKRETVCKILTPRMRN